MISSIENAVNTMIQELGSFASAFESAWQGQSATNLSSSPDGPSAITTELQTLKSNIAKLQKVLNDVEAAKTVSVEYNKFMSLYNDVNASESEKEYYLSKTRELSAKLLELEKQ